MRYSLIGFLIFFFFTGCSISTPYTPEHVRANVQKGKTTKEDIRKMYGEPSNVETFNGGNESWSYGNSKSLTTKGRVQQAVTSKLAGTVPGAEYADGAIDALSDKRSIIARFWFNKKGVVTSYTVDAH